MYLNILSSQSISAYSLGIKLMHSTAKSNATVIVQFLLDQGVDVDRPSSGHCSQTPLQASLQHKFIDRGAKINAMAPTRFMGRTALQEAVERGNMELVKYLISKGADVNAPAVPDGGVTALQAAAINGYLRLAQLLLLHGADIGAEASPKYGRTAVNGAAEHGRVDMVKYLLDNYQGDKSKAQLCEAALRYARNENEWDVIRLLKAYPESNARRSGTN